MGQRLDRVMLDAPVEAAVFQSDSDATTSVGGLNGLVHRLSIRWAWLAAGRAKGGGYGTVAGVAAGAGVGVVDGGVLDARDRARGWDGEE
jgi:hypothetical protein